MNVDEVLAKMDALDASEEEIQYIIDENLRVISIPPLGVVLGVEGDKDVNSAKFKMVRYYKGIDLSKFEIRINFANANGDLSYYTVKNPTITDDTLTFEWLVGYLVTKYKGTVRFVVRMIITDSSTGEVQQAFDTTVGEARSLEGLLVDTPTDEKVYDIVAQLKADLTDHVNNLLETIPEDYNELTKKVEDNTSGISELKEDLDDLDNKFTIGKNLINVDELSALGEWCNKTTGIFESNSYVTNYRHTPFIKVEPNTYYSRRYGLGINSSVVYFDNSKKHIGYSETDIFQTPNECAYVIVNIRDDIEPSDTVLMIKGNEVINSSTDIYPTPPYYEDFKYPNPNYIKDDGTLLKKVDAESTYVKKTDKDYVVVAKSGGDYTTVKEAFEYARANDKYVIIKPGTYDLVEEGISGEGYLLPKKVIGYGAKLVCNLENENWDLSPLNVDWQYAEHEVYGLEIECSNCKYCIHDEKGARTSGKYHHVFKDLHLIHNSNSSSVLIAPNNIGGGIGNGGYIEIDNCVFEQNGGYNRNIDYHTSFTGHQDDSAIIKCTNSVLNKRITITEIGTDTSFMNKMYVSNCLCGTIPTSEIDTNAQMIAWNNVSM